MLHAPLTQGAKVQTIIRANWSGMQQQFATTVCALIFAKLIFCRFSIFADFTIVNLQILAIVSNCCEHSGSYHLKYVEGGGGPRLLVGRVDLALCPFDTGLVLCWHMSPATRKALPGTPGAAGDGHMTIT